MLKQLRTIITVFLIWTLVGVISKVLFLRMYHSLIGESTLWENVLVLINGLRLDVAIAGYLTLVPVLLLIVSLWYNGMALKWIWNGYFALTAFVSALAYVSNLGLYGYWGFPLDNTPLLYIKTSPVDALASMTWVQMMLAPIAILLFSVAIFFTFKRCTRTVFTQRKSSLKQNLKTACMLVILGAIMIIPIRGGLDTGTNHTGSVYFSSNIRLNHAAVNPIFCFIESVSHQHEDLGNMYRFMADDEADRLFKELSYTASRPDSVKLSESFDGVGKGTNVIVVCLESFSKYIMDEGGHVKGVTPTLDRLTLEGVYFSRFYANSFRTDRALVSVFSGLPAQPTMSIMDIPKKGNNLPAMSRTLAANGYATHFYYGGDMNYSNMQSYFMATGFQQITADKDFSRKENSTKWGVPDGIVFDRMLKDISGHDSQTKQPFFSAIMTLSSHEPFDVPYNGMKNEVLNAFAYTDHCLGVFLDKLKKMPCWDNTLVVIVPDHLGAYPDNIDNYMLWRYELPLIMTGGAIKQPCKIETIGSQIDISATVLGLLNLPHDDFPFSKDLLDPRAPHFAFFTFPDAMGMVTDCDTILFDNASQKTVTQIRKRGGRNVRHAKAYLQKLYDNMNGL